MLKVWQAIDLEQRNSNKSHAKSNSFSNSDADSIFNTHSNVDRYTVINAHSHAHRDTNSDAHV